MPCQLCTRWDPEPQWVCIGQVDLVDTTVINAYSLDDSGWVWITTCRCCRLLRHLSELARRLRLIPDFQIRRLVADFE